MNSATFALVGGALLAFFQPLNAGIPEPDLVWYGKVTENTGGASVRVTSGTLVWRVDTMGGNPVMTRATELTNINDQFSFILRIPCESLEPGLAASAEMLPLSTTATVYLRTNITLNGQPIRLSSASGQFSVALADRGLLERVDLEQGTTALDSDGNGLADAWELQFFDGLGVNPDADPDSDGLNNLREYRAGTNPNNAQSRFEIVEINPVLEGIQIRWSSEPLHKYRVLRSASLLTGLASYEVVGSGLSATPPYNLLVDTTAPGTNTSFYVIQVED